MAIEWKTIASEEELNKRLELLYKQVIAQKETLTIGEWITFFLKTGIQCELAVKKKIWAEFLSINPPTEWLLALTFVPWSISLFDSYAARVLIEGKGVSCEILKHLSRKSLAIREDGKIRNISAEALLLLLKRKDGGRCDCDSCIEYKPSGIMGLFKNKKRSGTQNLNEIHSFYFDFTQNDKTDLSGIDVIILYGEIIDNYKSSGKVKIKNVNKLISSMRAEVKAVEKEEEEEEEEASTNFSYLVMRLYRTKNRELEATIFKTLLEMPVSNTELRNTVYSRSVYLNDKYSDKFIKMLSDRKKLTAKDLWAIIITTSDQEQKAKAWDLMTNLKSPVNETISDMSLIQNAVWRRDEFHK